MRSHPTPVKKDLLPELLPPERLPDFFRACHKCGHSPEDLAALLDRRLPVDAIVSEQLGFSPVGMVNALHFLSRQRFT
jgi:hypothetical protein